MAEEKIPVFRPSVLVAFWSGELSAKRAPVSSQHPAPASVLNHVVVKLSQIDAKATLEKALGAFLIVA